MCVKDCCLHSHKYGCDNFFACFIGKLYCSPVEIYKKIRCILRPCERQNFSNFVLLQNSNTFFSIFRIPYFPYCFIIKWSEFQETNKTKKTKFFSSKTPCFWVKNTCFWVKKPCSEYSVYTENANMADFRYPKPVQKYHILIGSKFLRKTRSDSNFNWKFNYDSIFKKLLGL